MLRRLLVTSTALFVGAFADTPFRPPCVPLDVATPYQSTWSCNDNLFDDSPQHWTGTPLGWVGLLRVDGAVYRYMGKQVLNIAAAKQESVTVTPTASIYVFTAGGARLTVEFRTPSFGHDDDLQQATRPVTTVSYALSSTDDQTHSVEVYFDMPAGTATAHDDQEVSWARKQAGGINAMRVGTTSQKVCGQGSDRSDWGYRYVAVPKGDVITGTAMAAADVARGAFVNGTYMTLKDDAGPARNASDRPLVLSAAFRLGQGTLSTTARLHLMFDEVVAMRYFGSDLAPLWTQYAASAAQLIATVDAEFTKVSAAATAFDTKVMSELAARGGPKYAAVGALVYRQAMGATTTAWNPKTGEAWPFMKEISSDGDVSTVDVIFPAFPLFMHHAPEFFRKLMLPLMVYSNNGTAQYGLDMKYNLAWAPHHLGHWPICDLAPSKQEQMPVEESGNMLIMIAGVAKRQSKARPTEWLQKYWGVLRTWADYLVVSLPDPGNQLCTDDFEGPNPHNVNLAAKGIVALSAYAQLLQMDGQTDSAKKYQGLAEGFAEKWVQMASDTDHYRRQFNLPGTWSQKYNLVWQKALGLDGLFPEDVFTKEEANYASHRNAYGVPLDDRHNYTKGDWSMWAASMGSQDQFQAMVNDLYHFAMTTPDRVPFTDWYDTKTGRLNGFRARPVMGGIFIGLLTNPSEDVIILL